MNKFVLGLSAAALALGGGAAFAQSGGPGHGPAGDMTWAQMQAKAAKMFDKLDVNHDGVINEADREAKKAEMFDRIDTNHDGMISKAEFMAAKGRHGDRGPGMAREGGQPGQPGMAMGKHGHHGGHGGMGMMMLHMADANHDGQVTKAESMPAAKAHFDKVDTNHDGVITKAERDAAHAAMRTKWQDRRAGMPGGNMAPPPPADDGSE